MNNTRHTLTYSVLAIAFGWGALWAGSQGAGMAFDFNGADGRAMVLSANVVGPSTSLDILIGGDIMMDRKIRLLGQTKGYDFLFASITPLFNRADITVANLEGPITSDPSKTLMPNGATTKALVFTFATTTAKVLARAGIDAVSLANNHTDNFGADGLAETRAWLDDAGLRAFGSPQNNRDTQAEITKNNITVAFVGYHQFQPGFENILADVRRLKAKGDFVIVMPHWGVEYQSTSTDLMKEQALQFAAAGADAIIGSHPHVIGQRESLDGVPVFYSLGNLLFDQYFSPEVMQGNMIELKLKKDSTGTNIESTKVYTTSLDPIKGVTFDETPARIGTSAAQ